MKTLDDRKTIYWYFVPVAEVTQQMAGYYDPSVIGVWDNQDCFLVKSNELFSEPAMLVENKSDAKYAFSTEE